MAFHLYPVINTVYNNLNSKAYIDILFILFVSFIKTCLDIEFKLLIYLYKDNAFSINVIIFFSYRTLLTSKASACFAPSTK